MARLEFSLAADLNDWPRLEMPQNKKKASSGRKKGSSARTGTFLTRVPAEEVLGDPTFDEKQAWLTLLQATTTTTVIGEDKRRRQITIPDYRIRMAALMYLTDKRDGKPGQVRLNAAAKTQPTEDRRLAEAVESLLPPVASE